MTAPGTTGAFVELIRRRSSVGVSANTSRTASLNCRMLEKPAAKAICANGNAVVSINSRVVCAR